MLMALKIDVLMAQLSSEDFLDTFSVSKDNLSLSGTQRSDWQLVALEEAVYFLHTGDPRTECGCKGLYRILQRRCCETRVHFNSMKWMRIFYHSQ
jgi:hypothetical protein